MFSSIRGDPEVGPLGGMLDLVKRRYVTPLARPS